jgi:hypothetical protein
VALLYRKSILYLVSRAYQHPHEEVPIVGMQRYWDEALARLPASARARTRSYLAAGPESATRRHMDFDNDPVTLNSLMAIVLGQPPVRPFTSKDLEEV